MFWHWLKDIQYIPRNMHTVFALLCFVVVIHWLIFPYPSGLLHWHCGNLTIAPVPAKQPWWIWINTSCEFIMNDCITTTKQSTTKPCAYFLGYTVIHQMAHVLFDMYNQNFGNLKKLTGMQDSLSNIWHDVPYHHGCKAVIPSMKLWWQSYSLHDLIIFWDLYNMVDILLTTFSKTYFHFVSLFT